jgi:hypothetical protein
MEGTSATSSCLRLETKSYYIDATMCEWFEDYGGASDGA